MWYRILDSGRVYDSGKARHLGRVSRSTFKFVHVLMELADSIPHKFTRFLNITTFLAQRRSTWIPSWSLLARMENILELQDSEQEPH